MIQPPSKVRKNQAGRATSPVGRFVHGGVHYYRPVNACVLRYKAYLNVAVTGVWRRGRPAQPCSRRTPEAMAPRYRLEAIHSSVEAKGYANFQKGVAPLSTTQPERGGTFIPVSAGTNLQAGPHNFQLYILICISSTSQPIDNILHAIVDLSSLNLLVTFIFSSGPAF
jgi:hypothetical protein